ncbi:MAG: hypothetical protein NZ959_02860, partial [Armatimonadetes bacterium]|nr:hypothetical protein [Armatimonadota bacterium]MDW8121481.1 hypothetical protein [Armatimonadota bacterium]
IHLSRSALSTLSRYKGRLVFVGDESLLTRDEYDRAVPGKWTAEVMQYTYPRTTAQDLWQVLTERLPRWGLIREITVITDTGKPVWAVDWKVARHKGSYLVNLCNLGHRSVSVRILVRGQSASAVDLLNREPVGPVIQLLPLHPRLIKID